MHSLIVVAHPNPDSLTHAIAQSIAQGIKAAGSERTCRRCANLNTLLA